MKAILARVWAIFKPENIGPMDIVIVLAIFIYALGVASYPESVAKYALLALLAHMRGREKTLRQIPAMVASMTQDLIQRMADDGVIQPGPNANVAGVIVRPTKGVH